MNAIAFQDHELICRRVKVGSFFQEENHFVSHLTCGT